MQHHPDMCGGYGEHMNIFFFHHLHKLFSGQSSFYFEDDDVCFYREYITCKIFFSQCLSDLLCMPVIFFQSCNMIFECINSCSSKKTCLPHTTAKHFSYPS